MLARPTTILFLAALAGCTTVEPVVALPSADAESLRREAEFQQEGSLDRLRQQDGRVANVAFRINVANVDLCEDKALLTGMALHHALQYGKAERAVAMRYFTLTGLPSVLTVVPGSPADKAGLKAGDALVSVDGEPFTDVGARALTDAPSYDETLKARTLLNKRLADGAGSLVIARGGERRTVTLTPVAGCAYEAQLIPSEDLNAWADGRTVTITTAFVRYAGADDQLAVVLGHELGHNVMKHRARIERGPVGKVLGNAGAMVTGGLLTIEREADYVGLYLMARAGYDYTSARDFWRNYAADFGGMRYAMFSHPGSLERATNIGATIDEITRKTAAGEPVVPTPARLRAAAAG